MRTGSPNETIEWQQVKEAEGNLFSFMEKVLCRQNEVVMLVKHRIGWVKHSVCTDIAVKSVSADMQG